MGHILCLLTLQISFSPAGYSQSLSHYKNLLPSHFWKHVCHFLVLLSISKYYLGQESDLKATNLYLFYISLLLVLYITHKCNSSLVWINKQHFLSLLFLGNNLSFWVMQPRLLSIVSQLVAVLIYSKWEVKIFRWEVKNKPEKFSTTI